MKKSLKKQFVPVNTLDEHNRAFYFWHKAKYEGCINEPLDLFHVDAHTDMGRAEKLNKSVYFPINSQDSYLKYYENIARNELHMASFIIPAVLNGLIRNVYFIYPKWRNLKPKRKKCNVCSAFGEGKILKHNMKINKNSDTRVFKAFPDLTYFNYSMHEVDKVPMNRKVILDVDLDYFACTDTILNHMSYELEITKGQFLKKGFFLNDETLQFSRLDFCFVQKNRKYYVRIAHKKVKGVSHLPRKEEIKSEIDTLVNTLLIKKTKPVVITICRSCISGYCPNNYYKFVETRLKKKIQILLDHN